MNDMIVKEYYINMKHIKIVFKKNYFHHLPLPRYGISQEIFLQ